MNDKTKKSNVKFRQPVDAAALNAEEDRRTRGEIGARGTIDGRFLKRKNRTYQIGVKTTEEKKKQFDRLRMLTGMSYTEIFEASLDSFENEWKEREN